MHRQEKLQGLAKAKKNGGKAKLNAECMNYGDIKENCIVCTDRTNVAKVSDNSHVWLSLCEEFFEILKENEVMKEIIEVIRRAKTKKKITKKKKKK